MATSNNKELDDCVRKNIPWPDIPIHLKQVRKYVLFIPAIFSRFKA